MKSLHELRLTVSSKWARWRRSRAFWFGVGTAALVGGAAAMVAFDAVPEVVEDLRGGLAHATPAELRERLKKDPKDADARVALGHGLFAARKRAAALKEYDRALTVDKDAVDEQLLSNLVAAFGTKQQGDAASILVRHKLVAAEPKLDDLASHKSYTVRWGALQTLERLGKASRSDYVTAWIADLEASKCEIRQAAIEKLGKEGAKRALKAIELAHKKDRESTPWFAQSCLGDRAEVAKKQILAAR